MIGVDFITRDKRVDILVVDAVPTIGSYVKIKDKRYKVLEVTYEYEKEWLNTRTSVEVLMENV